MNITLYTHERIKGKKNLHSYMQLFGIIINSVDQWFTIKNVILLTAYIIFINKDLHHEKECISSSSSYGYVFNCIC